ncbi:DUF4113 domain-containing protein [Marinobacter bryozoorum]|uniref:DUF4113 domain-containing protein n=1 Tax=Marinobacter bryozoorum TaxID=256324 RepID=UPI00200403D9|nr:DUF4113 domain-containing protein [Marinobacter bryozoorum]MCK7546179.1 DUF4113 domain-containing protein [Marinobacter bryozoorum]
MLPRGEPLRERWRVIPDDTDALITHGPPKEVGDQVTTLSRQTDLFGPEPAEPGGSARSERLMALMDQVNRQSRGALTTARQAGNKAYAMRRSRLSPAYTTDWHQLPPVS